MEPGVILEAKNLKKSYSGLDVLKGIDLSIKEHEVVSIVGSSGAGKTTLLQILGLLETTDSGSLTIQGNEVANFNEKKLTNIRSEYLGFVFQFHNLLPEFSALENILMPGWIAGKKRKELEEKAFKLLQLLGIEARKDHKPSELSGGEQQRVAVARALINEPAIVFADEPSGNLDSENAKKLHELFFNLRDDFNQTFVIVTHNDELADLADRKLQITDGQIV